MLSIVSYPYRVQTNSRIFTESNIKVNVLYSKVISDGNLKPLMYTCF